MLDELPPGRTPVVTRLVPLGRARRSRACAGCWEGRQAYVVCPLVRSRRSSRPRAAESEALELCAGELSDYRVGCIHGQLPPTREGGR